MLHFPSLTFLTPEQHLLLQCAQADPRNESDGIDAIAWPAFEQEIERHNLFNTTFRCSRLATFTEFPEALQNRLRAVVYGNAARCLELADELLRLVETLAEAGVSALPLKGVLLAEEAYGSLSARMAGDLDLLVRAAEVPAAADVLVQAGYAVADEADLGLTQALADPTQYHLPYYRQAGSVRLELHWRLGASFTFFPIAGTPLETAAVWQRARVRCHENIPVLRLAPEDQMLFLCLHGLKHRWQQLYLLQDIDRLLRHGQPVDWPVVLNRAQRLPHWFLEPALVLLRGLFDTPLPPLVIDHLTRVWHQHIRLRWTVRALLRDWLFAPSAGPGAIKSHVFKLALRRNLFDHVSYRLPS